MQNEIEVLVNQYEGGRISRRELIGGLCAVSVAMLPGGRASAAPESTFVANGVNHIALKTPNIAKSRDFYVKHLGLTVTRASDSSCFMTCEDNFVALFRADEPGLAHFCFSVKDFDVRDAEKKLNDEELNPRREGDRIYFDDPNGIEVQLAAKDHSA